MRFPSLVWLSLCAAGASAQAVHFERHEIRNLGTQRIAGSALDGKSLVTWGDRILSWDLPEGRMTPLHAKIPRALGPGGALIEIAGQPGLVVNEAGGRGSLLWIDLRTGKGVGIDHGISANEILPAEILGHRGILLVQRRMQVRFFEAPSEPAAAWPSHDIYSFYSSSNQGGLLLADVDRDGHPDILCGNYWIQSPQDFELPWRLFAIRVWAEDKLSGMVSMAWRDLFGTGIPNLIVSQSEAPKARVAWFEKPADPKQLWIEHRIEGELDLNQPRSLDVADIDGDGKLDLVVAERAGAGRLILFHNEGAGKFAAAEIGRTSGVVDLRVMHWNGDNRPDLFIVEPSSLSWWENR
jgi:hypothetical protein